MFRLFIIATVLLMAYEGAKADDIEDKLDALQREQYYQNYLMRRQEVDQENYQNQLRYEMAIREQQRQREEQLEYQRRIFHPNGDRW